MNDVPRAWAVDGPASRARAWLHRFGLHPGGSWSLAWVLLFAGGMALEPTHDPLQRAASCVLTALFGGLTWVGALAFAGRRAPLWILPAAFGLGLARSTVWSFAGPAAGAAFSLLYEPGFLLASTVVVWQADLLGDRPGLRLALTASFAGLVLIEIGDGVLPSVVGHVPAHTPWMVAVPVVASLQLGAMWLWIAQRELRMERAEQEQRSLAESVERERRADALLRRPEGWSFDSFEKAPDLLLVLVPGTCEIRRCSRSVGEALGRSRIDLEGRPLFDLVDPATGPDVRALLRGSWRRVRNVLLRFERPEGSRVAMIAHFALHRAETGVPELRMVLYDVTHVAPSVLALRSDPYHLLTENAAAGIFHSDETGRCALVNRSFCELTGLSPELAREGSWLLRVHPDDRRRVEQAWDRSVRDRTVFRAEHRLRAVKGSPLVLTECRPVSDEEVGGFVGSMIRLSSSEAVSLDAHRDGARARRGPRPVS